MDVPLGSGPYKVGRYETGHFIEYDRVKDWWGADLPVSRGLNNFDTLRWEFYRDREVAFEGFKAKSFLFNEEFVSRIWATRYDFPAIKDGRVKSDIIPDDTPSGGQGWFFNTRREKFKDPRFREALNYAGPDLEDCCRFLGAKFLETYPQVEGVQVSSIEMPYCSLTDDQVSFAPSGPERAIARIELNRVGTVEVASGIRGFKLLRLGGSAFQGFVRDQYTTLPDVANRPLHMWLDLEWLYSAPSAGFSSGTITAAVRRLVHEVFCAFESGSIQQVIYQIGSKILAEIPAVAEIHLEANNRTWDAIGERGDEVGVYTEPRPPYGCLGLRLRR